VIYAALFGFLGAKIFHNLENWNDFVANPVEVLLSFSGLTFYGGLICAAVAIWFYTRKHKINFTLLCDAIAPALILAYSIGRIGCQVAGDGDWGIFNSAFQVDRQGVISPATIDDFNNTVRIHSNFFQTHYPASAIPHAFYPKPGFLSFLPDWFFGYSFPHNVNETGVPLINCADKYCNQLPVPVFPTPLYETIICLILFGGLWLFRKRLKVPGTLFALYLILNGLERFFIEKIRVNTQIVFFGFHPTQAELISTLLIIAGIIIWIVLKRKAKPDLQPK